MKKQKAAAMASFDFIVENQCGSAAQRVKAHDTELMSPSDGLADSLRCPALGAKGTQAAGVIAFGETTALAIEDESVMSPAWDG